MTGAPHHPAGSTSQRTGEGQHLDAGIVAEGLDGDDLVLDRVCRASTDSEGTEEFKLGVCQSTPSNVCRYSGGSYACSKDHSPSVGDGAGRDTGSPSVGDIVGTVVVCILSIDRQHVDR